MSKTYLCWCGCRLLWKCMHVHQVIISKHVQILATKRKHLSISQLVLVKCVQLNNVVLCACRQHEGSFNIGQCGRCLWLTGLGTW